MRLIAKIFVLMFLMIPAAQAYDAKDMKQFYAEDSYPTAAQCAGCHQQIYNEWASSNHAYASISPMFHKFEQAINDLSAGTIGTFCVRCHQQVGTQRGEARELPLWDRSQVAREGVTCVTCHRVQEEFTKANGERTVVPGDIHAPVGGTMRGSVFDEVLERKDELKLATSPDERGQKIHAGVYKFDQLGKSEFCVSCHQVAVNLGIKLEVSGTNIVTRQRMRKGKPVRIAIWAKSRVGRRDMIQPRLLLLMAKRSILGAVIPTMLFMGRGILSPTPAFFPTM